MIEIEFRNTEEHPNFKKVLENVGEKLFAHLNIAENTEASVLLSNDETLLGLNREHRNEDHASDVLSFPNSGINPESGAKYIGDIAISLERAETEAKSANHAFEAEIQLLTIHGLLHLLGYDHTSSSAKKDMWKIQNEILDLLHVDIDRKLIGSS